MKKIWLILIALLLTAAAASAQDVSQTYWEDFFLDDFEENLKGWPAGPAQEGALSLDRQFSEGKYVWKMQTSEPNFSWIGFTPEYPADTERFRFQLNMQLPDFFPYTCGGILFEGQGMEDPSFYAYLVCNDKNYSLLHYQNGQLTQAIAPSPIPDFDSFSDGDLAVEINDGWADLLYNDTVLDTFNTGFRRGSVGLIAMPQSTDPTQIEFGSFDLYATRDEPEDRFEASEIDPAADENTFRRIKMLNMKDRVPGSAGTYYALPDQQMELASMGYFGMSEPFFTGKDLLLESNVSWSSAYDKPDYANSGCGFYIRNDDNGNYYEIYPGMDGILYINTVHYGQKSTLMSYTYDRWSVEGSGKLGIAADAYKLTVLWNDAILGQLDTLGWTGSGSAGYLIRSGTNADYGTRCNFNGGTGYLFE